MDKLYIANTCFEEDLIDPDLKEHHSLRSLFRNKVSLQLQFLPLLYGEKDDRVGVTHMPPNEFIEALENSFKNLPECYLLSSSSFPFSQISSWGASQKIKAWALKNKIVYSIPGLDLIRSLQSKLFIYENLVRLEQTRLIKDLETLNEWLSLSFFPKVLKHPLSSSGKGFCFFNQPALSNQQMHFVKTAFQKGLSLIGEPWVKRLADYSSHWDIGSTSKPFCLGIVECINDIKGRYQGNKILRPAPYFFQEHVDEIFPLLEKIYRKGYRGFVGIDFFFYQHNNGLKMHISEINLRQTMGLTTLLIDKRHFKGNLRGIYFEKKKQNSVSFLPPYLKDGEFLVNFIHQLAIISLSS